MMFTEKHLSKRLQIDVDLLTLEAQVALRKAQENQQQFYNERRRLLK